MDKDELKELLKKHLTIQTEIEDVYARDRSIKVTINFEGEEITSDTFYL